MPPGISYTLTIDDAPAPPQLLAALREIEVEDHAEMADMLRIRLAVAVAEDGGGWTVLDESLVDRLSKLELEVSIGSQEAQPLIEAYVIETRADFSNRPGESTLEIVAMDPSVLLNLDERVRPWPDMADSDIAESIFGEYGFDADVEPSQPTRQQIDRTTMQRATDMRFLRELARRNGYVCYLERNLESSRIEGHFHPPRLDQTEQGVLSVNLGTSTNVNRFQSRHDMLGPVTARATNLEIDGQSEQRAEIDESRLPELGAQTAASRTRPRHVLLRDTGLSEAGELQTYAQAVVDRSAFAIRAEGELSTVVYRNILRAKRPVNVRGAGRQFSGTYYVEKVLHRIGPDDYTQAFSLRRNALGVTGQENFVEDSALG